MLIAPPIDEGPLIVKDLSAKVPPITPLRLTIPVELTPEFKVKVFVPVTRSSIVELKVIGATPVVCTVTFAEICTGPLYVCEPDVLMFPLNDARPLTFKLLMFSKLPPLTMVKLPRFKS